MRKGFAERLERYRALNCSEIIEGAKYYSDKYSIQMEYCVPDSIEDDLLKRTN